MKGIKTAVKTEWKNYLHGNTREMSFPNDNLISKATGLKKGDIVYISFHAEWNGLKGDKAFNSLSLFQWGERYGYSMFYFVVKSSNGEQDFVRKFVLDKSFYGRKDIAETDSCGFYMHSNDRGISFEDGGYMKLTNVMLSKDKPLPYIDSDELKASGGVISKALIVALSLSGERRAA